MRDPWRRANRESGQSGAVRWVRKRDDGRSGRPGRRSESCVLPLRSDVQAGLHVILVTIEVRENDDGFPVGEVIDIDVDRVVFQQAG